MSITLQDSVYFGSVWQMLDKAGASVALGGGFANAQIIRSSDGLFFAGVIEKLDPTGSVTDVVIAFAGANGGEDFLAGESIMLGLGGAPTEQALAVAALLDAAWANPDYADARLHVMGHSLGAGFTQFAVGHLVATYGGAATDARADFVQFGTPGWGQGVASHFGLPLSVFDGRIVGYTAQNDPVLVNGLSQVGERHLLEAYEPLGANPLFAVLNAVSSHFPVVYVGALGLPDWLADHAGVIATLETQMATGTAYDQAYGPPGGVAEILLGDGATNVLTGSSAADVIRPGAGQDEVAGGGGADIFAFGAVTDSPQEAPDRITDYAAGDRIDLSAIDARSGTFWDDAFVFVGSAGFTGVGQVRVWMAQGDTWIGANLDADADAELVIRLDGLHTLSGADFIL